MHKLFLTYALFSIITICTAQNKVKKINVKDYGITAGTKENLTSKVNKLIEGLGSEPVEIIFPKGRYDFYPDANYYRTYYESNTYDAAVRKLAILIKDKKNITINAQQSDFVYHEHIQPFTLDNAENITIKNVNIDWDVPLTSEAEVIESDENHIVMKIDIMQSPYKIHEKGLSFAEVSTIPINDYNRGYEELGMPEIKIPNLVPIMREHGGHCTIPNCDLWVNDFTEFIKEQNKI